MATTKLFIGAPFGVQSARFDVSAVITQPKKPQPTFPQVLYSKHYLPKRTHMGPGMYRFSDGCFDEEEVKKAIGTGWAKAQEATRLTQLPHFQYKSIIKEKKFLGEQIGPGSYNYKDFIELAQEKPCSTVGLLSSGGVRFSKMAGWQNYFPGPGNYGKGGNPYTEMEDKAWDRAHTKGIMCTKAKKAFELPSEGSGLSPGTYTFKSGVEELLTRTISKRGPYDIFSGDRSLPIAYGHYATQKKKPFEMFSFKSFVDELNSNSRKKHGVFGKLSRTPTVPTERIYCSTLSQWPIKQSNLGPGSYNPKLMPGYELSNQYPFGSSSKRVDLKSYLNFVGNTNPVGVGRYNNTKHEASDRQQRYRSLYLSKPDRFPCENHMKESILQQRLIPFNKGKNFQPFDHSSDPPPSSSSQRCPRPWYAARTLNLRALGGFWSPCVSCTSWRNSKMVTASEAHVPFPSSTWQAAGLFLYVLQAADADGLRPGSPGWAQLLLTTSPLQQVESSAYAGDKQPVRQKSSQGPGSSLSHQSTNNILSDA
ncbi:ciliary microtubule-associated protein 2-like [Petaurus breviceps papuanus]|uniref:ciliary microtubule-associated protein 2-like n=1 Tax=Petaurus breviceps papuanus TaxID=3040969 RepID=UPI0036DDAEB9